MRFRALNDERVNLAGIARILELEDELATLRSERPAPLDHADEHAVIPEHANRRRSDESS